MPNINLIETENPQTADTSRHKTLWCKLNLLSKRGRMCLPIDFQHHTLSSIYEWIIRDSHT